jgi:protocatechuate 3,4-dioxygenase beta subunit
MRSRRSRIVVDLPAPFGPRNPNTSPRSTRRSRSTSASTVPSYVLESPTVSIAGDAVIRRSYSRLPYPHFRALSAWPRTLSDMDETPRRSALSRRSALVKIGGLAATALGAGAWGSRELAGTDDAEAAGAGPAAVSSGLVSCVLAPEQTEGPFYLDDHELRRDIREGRPGVPLTLRLTVLDVSTCRPIKGAAVDIWHCDSRGTYSGTTQATEDDRFLRGVQRTDAKGVARFETIYPGWYPGRTVHVHVTVHVGGNVVHTGQLYFSDRLTDAVFRRAPYSRRPSRTTRNAADSVYRNGGRRSTLKLKRSGTGYVGSIAMGVQR